jgi:GNAT superfamily N-acetyltransferase
MEGISSREIAALVEFGEAKAYADLYEAISPELAGQLGIDLMRLGPAIARKFGAINFTLFNAVVGLGIVEPAQEEMIDACIEFYRAAGVSFIVQVSPAGQPREISQWLAKRGFKDRDRWVKMYRGIEPPPPVDNCLIIREIGLELAEVFDITLRKGFEFPPQASVLSPLATSAIGRHGWHHYLGYDGDLPVSTAALFVDGEVGWCGMGSTIPTHRGRGGQGAMFARRIRDAADLGCRWLITETGEETSSRPNPSYRNMLRMGFQPAYMRPNYLYKVDENA